MNLSSLSFIDDTLPHNCDLRLLLKNSFHLTVTIWIEKILPSLLSIMFDQPEPQFNIKKWNEFYPDEILKLYAIIMVLIN